MHANNIYIDNIDVYDNDDDDGDIICFINQKKIIFARTMYFIHLFIITIVLSLSLSLSSSPLSLSNHNHNIKI